MDWQVGDFVNGYQYIGACTIIIKKKNVLY